MAGALNKYLTLDTTTAQQDYITAKVTSAGSGDAGKIFATASNGKFDPSVIPSANSYSISIETGASITGAFGTAHLVDLATIGGSATVTLPDPTTGAGEVVVVVVYSNSASHHVSFAPFGSETVNGAAASSLDVLVNIPQTYTFLSDGTNYETLSPLVDLPTQVSGILGNVHGGTGLDTSSAANGKLLIGNGSGLSLNLLGSSDSTISYTTGSGTLTLQVNQSNLALGSIGGSLSLSTQVGSSILPTANGGTNKNNTSASGHVLIGSTTTGYVDGAIGSGDSTVTWTLGAGTLTAQVNQGNLTLSSLGGAITVAQGYQLMTLTVTETIAAGALVNIFISTGIKVRNADNTDATKQADGYALTGAASGTIVVVVGNAINLQVSGLTAGTRYVLGTTGGVVAATSAPSTSGDIVQQVGLALSATSLAVQLGAPATVQ